MQLPLWLLRWAHKGPDAAMKTLLPWGVWLLPPLLPLPLPLLSAVLLMSLPPPPPQAVSVRPSAQAISQAPGRVGGGRVVAWQGVGDAV